MHKGGIRRRVGVDFGSIYEGLKENIHRIKG